jgi:hypothetical protein
MKYIFSLLITLFASITIYSQTSGELRPKWTKTVPNPPAGANYFLSWGVGEGYSEQQAINDAWADALQKSLHELGVVGITQQDIDAVAKSGIDAVTSFNKMKRRQLCVTNAIQKSNGKIMVYILIQVQRSVHGKDDFYDINPNICDDPDFDRKYKEIVERKFKVGARPLVPGWAQMYKGSTGKGIFFIAGEAVLIGGIVTCESLRSSYKSKIKTTHNPSLKLQYINNVNNLAIARNACIAGAAALYVWNIIDGFVAKGRTRIEIGDANLRITPYTSDNLTYGINLSLTF